MTLIAFRSAKGAKPEYTSEEIPMDVALASVRKGIECNAQIMGMLWAGHSVRVLEREVPGRVEFTVQHTCPGHPTYEHYFSVIDTQQKQKPPVLGPGV